MAHLIGQDDTEICIIFQFTWLPSLNPCELPNSHRFPTQKVGVEVGTDGTGVGGWEGNADGLGVGRLVGAGKGFPLGGTVGKGEGNADG